VLKKLSTNNLIRLEITFSATCHLVRSYAKTIPQNSCEAAWNRDWSAPETETRTYQAFRR